MLNLLNFDVKRIKQSVISVAFKTPLKNKIGNLQGVHKVLHTLKIFISQKPHKVETLHFRQ